MGDKELLELAALAAGIVGTYDCGVIWYKNPFGDDAGFNPLNNDGDAFRLAVKLRLEVNCTIPDKPTISVYGNYKGRMVTSHEDKFQDPYAATRRAIVRAAAEVGKGMLSQEQFIAMFPGRLDEETVERAAAEIGKRIKDGGE